MISLITIAVRRSGAFAASRVATGVLNHSLDPAGQVCTDGSPDWRVTCAVATILFRPSLRKRLTSPPPLVAKSTPTLPYAPAARLPVSGTRSARSARDEIKEPPKA